MAFTFKWAFRALPDEHWQIIGSFPFRRLPGGQWQGWNLTWYGFFNAVAVISAICLFLILMGSVSTPLMASLSMLTLLLAACLPAARVIAFLIEKKKNTFTVGGASFVGILIAPWIIFLVKIASEKWWGIEFSVMHVLAALSISYALGEGIGRLACISFGCCYGKPLSDCSLLINKIFQRHNFIFSGKTKKIAYAHGLDGVPVIPVQALTAIFCGFTGIAGCYLFLKGFVISAFVFTLTVTQVWRAFSEFLRADYRGEGKISGYQIMAMIACLYGIIIAYLFNETASGAPDLLLGLAALWNPAAIIFLTVLWIIILLYMGKSRVTDSLIEIHLINEKI